MNYLRFLYKYIGRLIEVDAIMDWYDSDKQRINHIRTFGTEQTYDMITTIEEQMRRISDDGYVTRKERDAMFQAIDKVWREYHAVP